jgi:hypothetical protein
MAKRRDKFTRFLEILPGTLTWTTLIGAPLLSYYHPSWIAVYIILFDLYWFLKGANVAIHLMHSYYALRTHQKVNWHDWLGKISNREQFVRFLGDSAASAPTGAFKRLYDTQLARFAALPVDRDLNYRRIYHLIILPAYQESYSVLRSSLLSYVNSDFEKDRVVFILALEERAGEEFKHNAARLEAEFGGKFLKYMTVMHPDGIPGEAKGKGANIAYAGKIAKTKMDELGVPYEDIIVSAFDSDTLVHPNYFSYLTYDFLTVRKPHQASYQPMPMFHNNIWDTPAIARVIATSSSFWQLVEASRPDRLITFSSHSMSFKTLVDIGFWRTDIIPEDSHIFWQCWLHYHGDYRTQPLFTTVSMDAVLGDSYFGTLVAQYKQKRRWAWGVTEISMVLPEVLKDKLIPRWKKFIYMERLIEGHYFWATASIMIAILGWMPLILGGDRFGESVLAVNLPAMTRVLMSVATFFLLFSVYINMVLLPKRPARYPKWKTLAMIFQWVFSPVVSSAFGSAPAIDAQTRLMLGKYMEFWVTPKIRKFEAIDHHAKPAVEATQQEMKQEAKIK